MSKFFTTALAAVAATAVLAPASALAFPFVQPVTPDFVSSAASDDNTNTFSADDFVLATGGTVTDVTWYGNFTDVGNDGIVPVLDFAILFFTDGGGFPASEISFQLPVVSASPTGDFDGSMTEIVEYSAALMGPELDAGLTYWIAIQNASDDEWVWARSNDTGSFDFDDGQFAGSAPGDLAFTINGQSVAVSEPGTLSVLGFGLLAAGFVARRRK